MKLYRQLVQNASISSTLKRAMLIDASDVVAAVDEETPRDVTRIQRLADFGRVAPPADALWVESLFEHPDYGPYRRGTLMESSRNEINDTVQWMCMATHFATLGTSPILSHPHSQVILVNADGLIDVDHGIARAPNPVQGVEMMDSGNVYVDASLAYVLAALEHMHTRRDVEKIAYPKNLQKRLARKEGTEQREFYWLVVTGTHASESSVIGAPSRRRATHKHTVRGHFRYYSPEKPLFGRVSGYVWVPPHERGDIGDGLERGYQLKKGQS